MNVGGTKAAPAKLSGPVTGNAELREAPSECRALVAVTPAVESEHEHAGTYRPAAFLAHLIATKYQLPQTRERRRAEPAEAIAAYRAAAALARH